MVEYRPLTTADLEAFYGSRPVPTIRGVGLFEDGKPIAVGGLAYGRGASEAFMELRDGAQRYPVSVMKATRLAMQMMRDAGARVVFAKVDTKRDTAPRFLSRLGFTPMGDGRWMWHS